MNKVCRTFLFYVCTLFIWLSIVKGDLIDISNYNYPKRPKGNLKATVEPSFYQIAIFATTDLHGFILPEKKKEKENNLEWEVGGMELLTSYIEILKKEWGKRFIWLDAGDEFQGGFETKLTKGKIMTDILNKVELTAGTFGNHEFDDGVDLLKEHVKQANFSYITANIFEGSNDTCLGQKPTQVFTVGKVKIGVIGITTKETVSTTKGDIKNYTFKYYPKIIEYYANQLKQKDKVDAVILLTHAGNHCQKDSNITDLLKLQLWNKTNSEDSKNKCNAKGEIIDLLNGKDKITEKIDLVIAGHTHEVSHFFYNGVPVVSSINNAKYANVIYLSFNSQNKKNKEKEYILHKDKILIEGPLPICSKVFSENYLCDVSIDKEKGEQFNTKFGNLSEFTFHSTKVEKIKKWEQSSKVIIKKLGKKARYQYLLYRNN